MTERGNLNPVYGNIRRAVDKHAFGSSSAKQAGEIILDEGIGVTDNYQLFDRASGKQLPVDTSPMYAPSQIMMGLDLSRIVDVDRLSEVEIKPRDVGPIPVGEWFVGDRMLLSASDDVVGFVGKRGQQEVILSTTPENVVFATKAILGRGVNPQYFKRRPIS